MAKTYNSIPSVATGDVLTATAWNNQATNVNNYRVPPYCRVKRSADTSGLANGADIAWDAEDYDTDAMHDNSTNNTRITINTDGLYLVTFCAYVTFTGTATQIAPAVFRDGSTQLSQGDWYGSRATDFVFCHSAVVPLTATQYITARVYYSGATASSLVVKNATTTSFSAMWMGQVS